MYLTFRPAAPHSSLPHALAHVPPTSCKRMISTRRICAMSRSLRTCLMTHLLGMTELPCCPLVPPCHDVTLGSGRGRDAPLRGPAMRRDVIPPSPERYLRACRAPLGTRPSVCVMRLLTQRRPPLLTTSQMNTRVQSRQSVRLPR